MIWTEKHDASLRAWFGAGLSAGQIAEVLGITRNMVCGRKFRLGICNPEKVAKPFSDDDIATIIAMREQKIPNGKIAKSLRRSEASIAIKASKMGITRPYRMST